MKFCPVTEAAVEPILRYLNEVEFHVNKNNNTRSGSSDNFENKDKQRRSNRQLGCLKVLERLGIFHFTLRV
jgi:hypothetical protein